MDLEGFNNINQTQSDSDASIDTPADALRHLDACWYSRINGGARWMDLIGDYAGSEPFIIDGESLIHIVLEDPLLALGRENSADFQILHALHSVEKALNDFCTRSAVFEIVFWEDLRHHSISTGQALDTVSARILARRILFNHIRTLQIPVHTFKDATDPAWLRYRRDFKPMFIIIDDGGVLRAEINMAPERTLVQRFFVLQMLSSDLPVSLLKGRSSVIPSLQILAFVCERGNRMAEDQALHNNSLMTALAIAKATLERQESDVRRGIERIPLHLSGDAQDTYADLDQWLTDSSLVFCKKQSFSQIDVTLLYLFIVHCLLADTIGVAERAQPNEPLNEELSSHMRKSFLPTMFLAIEHVSTSVRIRAIPPIDGRVFVSLIRYIIVSGTDDCFDIRPIIGTHTYQRASAIWSLLTPLIPNPDFVSFAGRFPVPPSLPKDVGGKMKPLQLWPFSNAVFDAHLPSIKASGYSDQDESGPSAPSRFQFGTAFRDTQHWHNTSKAILPQHLGGENSKPLTERERRKVLRREQRFMSTLHRHASTLTSASGAVLEQTKIAPVEPKPSNSLKGRAPPERNPTKNSSKKKPSAMSKKQLLLNKISDEKEAARIKSLTGFWKENIHKLSKMPVAQQLDQLEKMQCKEFEDPTLATEVRLYKVHLHLKLWIEHLEHDSGPVRDRFTVTVVRLIKDINGLKNVTPTVAAVLASVLLALGFSDHVPSLASPGPEVADRPLSFDFIKLVRSKAPHSPYHKFMRITEHPVVWQLRLFGQYMDRTMDSQPDKRVKFDPDAWQRDVLDAIDENSSLLVVAPTSAGKTFISFYAIEKVLRESNDGIIVYVAPTKALVVQIAAEMYARFSKNLNGCSFWAIHTRDYRIHEPQKCQVLVTVPEMLAIMLLSPPLARVWIPRIKRVILDEIHSIGQQEGGSVWEQIILLTLCPIIGLSATVGSPQEFNDWLASVQKSHGHKHVYINYPHRYSHLRKYHYDLQQDLDSSFGGLDMYRSSDRMRFLHPIAMLDFGVRPMPPDLVLEAPDTLALYNVLAAHKESMHIDIESLDPTKFFQENSLLRQKDIIRYEEALKELISSLTNKYDPQDPDSPLRAAIRDLEPPELDRKEIRSTPSEEQFLDNLINLASDLHVAGRLPAIFFSFDRTGCEHMAQKITEKLQVAEKSWRKVIPKWQQKIRQWEAWQKGSKERQRLAERTKKRAQAADESKEAESVSWESSFNPDDPSPQFSFAGERTGYSKAELDQDISDLRRWSKTPDWIVEALRRGIAIHHSGMNKAYRSLIESLFRLGFIRIMIATGTLALGINAPTKTAVFCGDSPFLTALMFRQCSGRAGRRGFDLLGHVVFYGLSLDRVQRLILSRLPSLRGHFPLTSTMCLRLFNLLDGSDYHPYASQAIDSILKLPQISIRSEAGRDQVLHHLRFSIEYLRRAHLLDEDGKPTNLFALAQRLYYTEPSNFAMVVLLRLGVLHAISARPSFIDAKRDFILLMANLFGRRKLPKVYTTEENLQAVIKNSPSMVLLPPLQEDARAALRQHDREILRIFTTYAVTFAEQHQEQLGEDCLLPVSGLEFPSRPVDKDSIFRVHLRKAANSVVTRSKFVANSGHIDEFESVEELARTARRGLHLNAPAIPSMTDLTSLPSKTDLPFGLNAYLLDFYMHGQADALSAANAIRRGDVWYALQDFLLSLMTLRGAVQELLSQASNGEQEAVAAVSYDPAEADDEERSENAWSHKPRSVSDEDWRLYEMINEATEEFANKFRATWA